MTQIKEISHDGLTHKYSIKLPQSAIAEAVTQRLAEIGKTARIQGFRPGKAPMPILRQRFGDQARDEALNKQVADTVQQLLKEHSLRPAMQPEVDVVSDGDAEFEFNVTVEALPEITPIDFSALKLEKLVAEVEESVIDETLARIAKNAREPEIVEEKRKAQKGDVLVIDFDGKVDGTAFPGMKDENHRLELGSKSFIDTFEDQLVGTKVGDQKDVTVTFPETYHAKNLAGKTAVFAVTIKELRAHKPLEMNEALATELGFPSLTECRRLIAEETGKSYTQSSRLLLKRQLLDQLADKLKFPIPARMAEAEFNAIWQELQKEKAHGHLPPSDAKKSDDELRKDYQEIAERRIRLGLLMADVATRAKIEVKPEDLRNAVMNKARQFPGQEKAIFEYYTKTQGALDRLRAPILEEKVTDYILAQAHVSDKKTTIEELNKRVEEID